ncbi:MAG: alpha/beta hydrolase family protein, partial [Omnitrophica WOR_2 bacterium]
MRKVLRLFRFLVLLILSLLLVSCSGLLAPRATPTPAGPTPTPLKPMIVPSYHGSSDTPSYAKSGQYAVGLAVTHFHIKTDISMVYIWYPMKEDKSPETAGNPYPLVIYSSGGWTGVFQFSYFLEVLASHGFVVMAADPRDAGPEAADWSPTVINRTQDTRLLISQADKMTAPGGQLAGLIDMDKIASTGVSAGGWTALVG